MEIFNWKVRKNIFFFLFIGCLACGNKELTITPMGGHIYHMGGEENPLSTEFQYYTIDNYKYLTPDSLYTALNTYINSRYSYDKIIGNIGENGEFVAFFYKKDLFENYEKYLRDAIHSETGSIYEKSHKLVAKIYCLRWMMKNENYVVFYTVLYDKDSIILSKTDALEIKIKPSLAQEAE